MKKATARSVDYDVNCYMNETQDFYHLSKVHAGLLELEPRGKIALRFQFSKPVIVSSDDPPWTPWLQVTRNETGDERLIVVDLADRSDVFSLEALGRCDVYYKRNLFDSDVESMPEELKIKIRPFGLNYGCRVKGQLGKILRPAIPRLLSLTFRSPIREIPHTPNRIAALRQFLGVLPVGAYEQPPTARLDPVVFFQARVWPPSEYGSGVEEVVNRPRVELARALRKEFGKRFVGGLIPTEYAKRHFPDAISRHSCRRDEYIAMGRRALIGVASVPCVATNSFKLAEYLAASKCIVAPQLRNQLPVPLEEGIHYLSFQSIDECVARCVVLLEDAGRAAMMRRENWKYYHAEVAPAQHVENLLKRAFLAPTLTDLTNRLGEAATH